MYLNQRSGLRLLLLCVVFGFLIDIFLKHFPVWEKKLTVIDQAWLYPKVSINMADKKTLMTVPYIGPVTAEKIIRWRKQHGPFQTVDDVLNVPGIGRSQFRVFGSYLKVTP